MEDTESSNLYDHFQVGVDSLSVYLPESGIFSFLICRILNVEVVDATSV